MKNFKFSVQKSGRRLSSIDERPVLKVLSGNGRFKITDNLKKVVGIDEHLSFGIEPQKDDNGDVFTGVFPSVKNAKGDYVNSSKISKIGEFTDMGINKSLRDLVISEMSESEKKDADNYHFVFALVKDENDDLVTVEGEIEKQKVTVYALQYIEKEEKLQRNSSESE